MARSPDSLMETLDVAKVTAKPNGNGDSTQAEPEQKGFTRLLRPASRTGNTFDQAMQYWAPIHKEFPGRVFGYLFRLFPIIIKPDGEKHYIAKYNEPIPDQDWILKTWGTGQYRIILSDNDLPKRGELLRCDFGFKESYAECPPVLDYLELDIGHKENRSYIEWARAKGLLKVPGDTHGGSQAENTAVAALARIATEKNQPHETLESEAASTAFEIMGKATEAAIKTVQAQNDPSAMLKLVEAVKGKDTSIDLVSTILKIQADASAQQSQLLKTILEITAKKETAPNPASQIKEIAELIKSLQPPRSEPQGLSHVREIAETVNVLKDVFGRGQGKPEWYEAVLSNPDVMDVAKTVAGGFWNWSQATMMNRGPGFVPQPQPQPAPASAPGLPGAVPPVNQPTAPQNEESMNLAALGEFMMPRFGAFMEALNSGMSGAEFAQELFETRPSLGGMDLGTHTQIKAIGRDKILSLLGMAPPEVKALLAGKQTLLTNFLGEFLAWIPAEEEIPLPEGMPGARP